MRRRIRPNPHIVTAARASGLPVWQLSLACGCPHASRFTALLHSGAIPATPRNLALFSRLCDVLKFPHAQAFLDDPAQPVSEVERLRARVVRLEREAAVVR